MGMPKAAEVTEKQKELYFYLVLFIEDHGYQPSIEEMAETFEVARKSIQDKITLMEEHGIMRRGQAKHERCVGLRHVGFKAIEDSSLAKNLPAVSPEAAAIHRELIRSVCEEGYQLTSIEIAGTFNISRTLVRKLLHELEENGWVALRKSDDGRLLERCVKLNGVRFESVYVPEY